MAAASYSAATCLCPSNLHLHSPFSLPVSLRASHHLFLQLQLPPRSSSFLLTTPDDSPLLCVSASADVADANTPPSSLSFSSIVSFDDLSESKINGVGDIHPEDAAVASTNLAPGQWLLASHANSEAPTSLAAVESRDRRKVVRTAWETLVRWSRSWRLLHGRKETNVLQTTKKVVVAGGGSFGTAMAVMLARNKSDMHVSLLLRDASVCESINKDHVNRKYFPKHKLPHNIVATTDVQEAFEGSQFCIHAVPVQFSTDFLKSISKHVPANLPIFSVSKGLEVSSLEMMSQVIPRALANPRQPIAVISGPSFSIELMDELPTAMVVASKDKELARAAQQLLASQYLRINTSSDVVGVEIAGALKNVLAIAAGIVEGMNLGNNCMAALVAQGCSEIRWLAEKMGAKSTTLAGLSGTGDIMLTCFVNLSRNRTVGVRLGAGESLDDILSSMNQVAEGVATAGAVIALARKYRVQMPVLTAVARILENELTPKKAVLELMSLPQVEEA